MQLQWLYDIVLFYCCDNHVAAVFISVQASGVLVDGIATIEPSLPNGQEFIEGLLQIDLIKSWTLVEVY